MPEGNDSPPRERWPQAAGIVEWFQPGEFERVERAIADMKALGVRRLRTGFSWADYHRKEGRNWYKWLLDRLTRDLEVLPCFTYTPPSLGIEPKVSSPPLRAQDYADFLDVAISVHGKHFEYVELWNEPNNQTDWDYRIDTNWQIFSDMIGRAAYWVGQRGKKRVLGGMSPFDPNWLTLMGSRGVLEHIDVIGLHGFPGTWDHEWTNWNRMIQKVRETILPHFNPKADIWITEGGYSTWNFDELTQLEAFLEAADAGADRIYWYALHDLHPDRSHQGGGFHADERHYHLGLYRHDGSPKLAPRLLTERGVEGAHEYATNIRLRTSIISRKDKPTLITGGAGFIGTNLAHAICSQGKPVRILDNLSRPGVESNLEWLCRTHDDLVEVEVADVREPYVLRKAARNISQAFHLAAQVAVTTSLDDPARDFAINAQGTLNLLEALRLENPSVPLLFTSTNKVYGELSDIPLVRRATRYQVGRDCPGGVSEDRILDFHSPYGASKGSADQYVLDYARSFGMTTTVFRMSCIYGPHQHGTEDQGWVAHFIRTIMQGRQITLYGDGLQVRDILFVEDLVEALLLAQKLAPRNPGQAYNIGGGIKNSVSLLECIDLIQKLLSDEASLHHGPWRTGDQKYYVSDHSKFTNASGWTPQTNVGEGLARLCLWLTENRKVPQLSAT